MAKQEQPWVVFVCRAWGILIAVNILAMGYLPEHMLLFGPFGAAIMVIVFLPPKPWVWWCHLGIFTAGFPLTLPFIFAWFKPETQRYYGRGTPPNDTSGTLAQK